MKLFRIGFQHIRERTGRKEFFHMVEDSFPERLQIDLNLFLSDPLYEKARGLIVLEAEILERIR